MARRKMVIYGALIVLLVLTTPAIFIWARTMVYWLSSPNDSPVARSAVVAQLIDSANNSESRGQYYPKTYSMSVTPHCDQLDVDAPARWTDFHRKRMNITNETRQWTISDYYQRAAEGKNLTDGLSVNQMALLAACMEATPFGGTCRRTVNGIRWDHEKAEHYLIKRGHLERLDGKICIAYPEFIFISQDQK